MDKKVQKEWVKALQSDDYEQGFGNLCKTVLGADKFCCLGVLIDIAYDGDWHERGSQDGDVKAWGIKSRDGMKTCYPPAEFLESVGLSAADAERLASMNDSGNHSFKSIAVVVASL